MSRFIGHKIINDQGTYIVLLYLDQQLNEFANEFMEKTEQNKRTLNQSIRSYINDKIPNLKIKTVNILLGSLLIVSLPFSNIEASSITNSNEQSKTFTSYIVKPGDALYKIAQQYKVTIEELKIANSLQDDMIFIGQTLHVPRQDLSINFSLPYGIFRIGNRGDDVKIIQRSLNELGYLLVEDGIYGLNTKAAILDFQNQYSSLVNDGIYGPQTKEYLQDELVNKNITVSNPEAIMVLVNKSNRLPSNYIPENLVVPNIPFSFEEYYPKKLMRQESASALEELFEKAKEDNIKLFAISGYRSYDRQEAIFTSNVMKYGIEKTRQFSAQPGESEHQTGLAMDVTSPSVNYRLTESFGQTIEGKWLSENAPQFGFIIRYPKGKEDITGYQYEPWHIRFIGKEAAIEITAQNITLEEYFNNID